MSSNNGFDQMEPEAMVPPAQQDAAEGPSPAHSAERREGEFDPARQQKAREYAQIKRRLLLVDVVLSALVPLLWLVTGFSLWVRDQLPFPLPIQVALFAAVFGLTYAIVFAPLTFYTGFILPRRYGLSTQSLSAWLWDGAKGALVGGILGLALLEIVYFLLSNFPTTWWIFAAGIMLLFTVVLANLAPVIILPLFYKLSPLEDQNLAQRLLALAERAHTRVRGVYKMDMSSKGTAANAALMGLGNTRRIVLGDTLLGKYDDDEIVVILAHELGHHVHHDIVKGILMQTIFTTVSFYIASVALRLGVEFLGLNGVADVAALPLFVLVTGAFMFWATPITNAFTRHIEKQADEYALQATGDARAFISMMAKLTDQNLSEATPALWAEILFYDHPPTAKRIALAESYLQREAA